MFVEIVDARTIDIMRREEEKKVANKEPTGMTNLYAITKGPA